MKQFAPTRRAVLAGLSATFLCVSSRAASPEDALAALERAKGGRLGVHVRDLASGRAFGHRADERFAFCSTFKLPLVGFVLREAGKGALSLEEIVPYTEEDLIEHAPVTRGNLAKGGLSIRALCEAAQTVSDGTAANLLVRRLGGLEAVTARFRAAGDEVTRLDRWEPELTEVDPGDPRDTTSPRAMAGLVGAILSDGFLTKEHRDLLLGWMIATETGKRRIRAGLPADWIAGDKTGTGRRGFYNDVAIAWPPGRPPVLIAAYYDSGEPTNGKMSPERQAVLAEAGRIAAAWALA